MRPIEVRVPAAAQWTCDHGDVSCGIGDSWTILKELTKRNEALDEGIFVSMLGLEYAHNDEPAQVKRMIVAAEWRFGELVN
ncbi:hypothetical protein [Tardiphaga sp.]|uniref:hypothetical protein n=1 Tax=Tardiphaga sp. TaxID=1926292 RepID=UPI00352AC23F